MTIAAIATANATGGIGIVRLSGEKSIEIANKILSEKTNKTVEQIYKDTERDNYMFSNEALEYGLIDKIIGDK